MRDITNTVVRVNDGYANLLYQGHEHGPRAAVLTVDGDDCYICQIDPIPTAGIEAGDRTWHSVVDMEPIA